MGDSSYVLLGGLRPLAAGNGLLLFYRNTDVLVAVRTLSNGEIDFALAVSFGLIITVYMALFVATNLNDLSRRLRRLGMLRVLSDPKTRHR